MIELDNLCSYTHDISKDFQKLTASIWRSVHNNNATCLKSFLCFKAQIPKEKHAKYSHFEVINIYNEMVPMFLSLIERTLNIYTDIFVFTQF